MKITDIPFAQPNHERDYRSYKIQFQAPPNVGIFTWKVQLVSDTFIGEDVTRDITVRDIYLISTFHSLILSNVLFS